MLVCVFLCANCTRDRGCSVHPVFPAPSDLREGEIFAANLGRSAPRDREAYSFVVHAAKRSDDPSSCRRDVDGYASIRRSVLDSVVVIREATAPGYPRRPACGRANAWTPVMLYYNVRPCLTTIPTTTRTSPRPRPFPWPGDAASGAGRALVDPAHDRDRPPCRGARGQRRAVGRRAGGDEVSMAAQLKFHNVTLGYDRHPAVHHLNGEVAAGALLAVIGPNGAGKSTLFRGLAGILKPLSGSIDLGGLDIRDIAYLPQSVDIDRNLSDFGVRSGRHRPVAHHRIFRRHGQGGAGQDHARRSPPSASTDLRTARSARCPAARCSACCSRACCCRTRA